MAYTDVTASFPYKALLTTQLMTDLALNDKLFNDQLTGAIDIPNDLKLANAKYLRGEVLATGTWRTLVGLDASNIVQVGDAACEARVPADPTNVLGIATKQYVDGVQMFRIQSPVTANGGSGSLVTILNLTATTRGHILGLYIVSTHANSNLQIVLTIDGTITITITVVVLVANLKYRYVQPNMKFNETDLATVDLASALLNIPFNSSLLVQAQDAASGGVPQCTVIYDKIP